MFPIPAREIFFSLKWNFLTQGRDLFLSLGRKNERKFSVLGMETPKNCNTFVMNLTEYMLTLKVNNFCDFSNLKRKLFIKVHCVLSTQIMQAMPLAELCMSKYHLIGYRQTPLARYWMSQSASHLNKQMNIIILISGVMNSQFFLGLLKMNPL